MTLLFHHIKVYTATLLTSTLNMTCLVHIGQSQLVGKDAEPALVYHLSLCSADRNLLQ